MSMVTKYAAILAGSALLAAIGLNLLDGTSPDLFLQPYYWVVSICLTGLAGLCMGNGIGSTKRRPGIARMTPVMVHPTPVRSTPVALAA